MRGLLRTEVRGLFYITDCSNLSSIIDKGIFSRNKLEELNIDFEEIAWGTIINIRKQKTVSKTGKPLLNYANLYFNPRNPMLSMRRTHINNIAIVQVSPKLLDSSKNLVSDGNSASHLTTIFFLPEGLKNVDYDVIMKDSTYSPDLDSFPAVKRKRMAEVLVEDYIPPEMIKKVHFYNNDLHSKFLSLYPKSRISFTTRQDSPIFEKYYEPVPLVISDDRIKFDHKNAKISHDESMVKVIKGNMFNTEFETIVNSINCVGVMGAGIALGFRLRYPEMFKEYKELCEKEEITIGKLWIYNAPDGKKIINFPSKHHWKLPSKYEYLESGLQRFIETYEKEKITSVAFPVLGASKGGLPEKSVLKLMQKYLSKCDIPVEIYTYDEFSKDDIFDKFKERLANMSTSEICKATGLRKNYVTKVKDALEDENIRNMPGLGDVQGIGIKTIEKCFEFTRQEQDTKWF